MVNTHVGTPPYNAGKRAASLLAEELNTHLRGMAADPDSLADWLRRRWHIISPLAHTIHETPGWPPQSAQEGATNSEQGSL